MRLPFIKLDMGTINYSKIKIILKMSDSDSLLILWIVILCLGIKLSKTSQLEVGDPVFYGAELLSNELGINKNTAKLGLETLIYLKMIEVFSNGSIFISNFEKHQNISRIEHNKKIGENKLIEAQRNTENKLRIFVSQSDLETNIILSSLNINRSYT